MVASAQRLVFDNLLIKLITEVTTRWELDALLQLLLRVQNRELRHLIELHDHVVVHLHLIEHHDEEEVMSEVETNRLFQVLLNHGR